MHTATLSAEPHAEPVPVRAGGVELLGRVAGSGYRRAPSLARRADGQTIQLTPLLAQVLDAIDGRRSHSEIAAAVSQRTSRLVTAEDVRWLIDEKLRPLGVLRGPDGSDPAPRTVNPLLALSFRKVISDPKVTRRITAPFAGLFRPGIVAFFLVAFGLVSAWVLLEQGLASATYQALHEPGMLLLVVALGVVAAGFHEFGHAAACRSVGVTPGAMGVGLYLVWPVFYTDVSDSYRVGRRARIRVDTGGLYFNAIFTVAVVALWVVTRWDALLLLVPAQLLNMLRQLLPVVRFDGYHILADLTGVPDLFAHIKPTLLRMLPTRWGSREPHALRPWARAVVTLWVLTVIPLLVLALALVIKVLPRVAATLADSLGPRWNQVQTDWVNGQPADVGVGLLAIATLAIPVLSMTYVLQRVVRRTGGRVWRSTEGRPHLRTLSVLAGLAGLALIAWAWWPQGQYRPIHPDERGTLLGEAPPSPEHRAVLTSASTPLGSGTAQPRLVVVLSPDAAPDTESGPIRLIEPPQVDGITSGGTSPAQGWVFPFDLPAPPEEGDNQALAVNTEDGSSVYDVAVAVLWVTDGSVDEVNEAWAVASCSECLTVAVAFQSVFVLGEADVVVPQNLAVAVNYECHTCHTEALAVQLVATLGDLPSDEAMDQLALVWQELAELENTIGELSLEEIHAQLVAFEETIIDILVEDGALVMVEGDSIEAAVSDAPEAIEPADADTAEMPSEETTTTDEPTPAGDDAGASTDPSPTPTDEPSPTPEEPSPTPSEEPSPTSSPEPSPTAEPSPTPTG